MERTIMNKKLKCAFTSEEIYELLGGYWYTDDENTASQKPFFAADYFVTGTGLVESPNTCFVAMTKETWLKGSGNGGHYKDIFSDSHITLVKNYSKLKTKDCLVGIIAERQIPELLGILPQLIVDNPYEAIKILAIAARDKMADNGTIIAVTGAVGKSTTVNMLHHLLNDEADYISNINGHNSRTGVPMWLASVGRFNPDFKQSNDKPNVCTLEIAASALWMRAGGICKVVKPHIGIITHIALTQWQQGSRNIHDVAVAKSKVCQGIVHGGKAVLYRDVPEFDFIKEAVTNYGATPVTYGEESNCDTYVIKYEFEAPLAGEEIMDLSTNVDAVILGEKISYKIGTIGKPVVLNSLAALTAVKLAGFDVETIAQKFAFFKGNANTLQLSNCGGVCILDCTLTLEMPSIIAAFDLLKQIKQKPGSRKIVLLSRIVNLGEKAPELHLQLTRPITKSKFDKFFFHEPLDEFKYLINTIPNEMAGGRYNTAEEVVDAVADYIREGDSILVMGAKRGCDFGKVLGLLSEKILANKESGKLSSKKTEVKDVLSDIRDTFMMRGSAIPSCAAYSLDNKKRIMENGDMSVPINEGIGHILTLRLALSSLIQEQIRLTDLILMGELAWRERNVSNALSVSADERINLKTLLDAYVAVNAPDAIIAVSHFVFSKNNLKSNEYFKQICANLSLDTKVAVNLTGRKNRRYEQCYTINDLEKIAAFFFSLSPDAYTPLKATVSVHKEKILKSNSVLYSVSNIISYYCFGENSFNAITHAKIKGENIAVAVCGANTASARDTAVCELLEKLENKKESERHEYN
jgi:UDP-N-acetylmuramyl pentapeptide synthase